MKKRGLIILLVVFVFVVCLSQPLCGLLEGVIETNHENRTLASKPDFTIENMDTFIEDYNRFANDHMLLRNNLVTLNNYLDYYIFQQAANTNVILGKNNWLFYANANDGDPIGSYKGANLYTEEELAAIADNCAKQKEYMDSLGKEFVIFIAPNKERVYSEYLPDMYGDPSEQYRALQIVNYLRKNTSVKVIYPYEELVQAKALLDTDIYFKTDTHWNSVGAYVGTRVLLHELGIDLPAIEQVDIAQTGPISGDLQGMIGLAGFDFGDSYYSVSGYDTHGFEYLEYDFAGNIKCKSDSDPRRIYVVRDSFGSAMVEIIGSQFSESCFRHFESRPYSDLLSFDPDIVVYETVERYSFMLGSFSLFGGE